MNGPLKVQGPYLITNITRIPLPYLSVHSSLNSHLCSMSTVLEQKNSKMDKISREQFLHSTRFHQEIQRCKTVEVQIVKLLKVFPLNFIQAYYQPCKCKNTDEHTRPSVANRHLITCPKLPQRARKTDERLHELENGEGERYLAERVVKVRYICYQWQYFVKWEGFSEEHNTWQGRADLVGSRRLVVEFWDRFFFAVKNGTISNDFKDGKIPNELKPISTPDVPLLDHFEFHHELNIHYTLGSEEMYDTYERHRKWAQKRTRSPSPQGYESNTELSPNICGLVPLSTIPPPSEFFSHSSLSDSHQQPSDPYAVFPETTAQISPSETFSTDLPFILPPPPTFSYSEFTDDIILSPPPKFADFSPPHDFPIVPSTSSTSALDYQIPASTENWTNGVPPVTQATVICPYCEKSYGRKTFLRHQKGCHLTTALKLCWNCGDFFPDHVDRGNHRQKHPDPVTKAARFARAFLNIKEPNS